MKSDLRLLTVLAITFTLFLLTAPANAQATRTWVSGVGDDVNPCSRTAPCKTFAGAISKTAAGGEINCIDPGGFGGVTITKAMTIDCLNTEAGVLVSGTNGIVVSAGAGDVVTLRGLDIFGTAAAPALNGIRFNTGAALHVENCVIRQFQTQTPFPVGYGILFSPTAASELFVTDTTLTNNGAGSAGGAITVRPTGSGSAKVTIARTRALNNVTGFTSDTGTGPTSGDILMVVRDSISSGNSFTGFSAVSGANSGFSIILMDHSVSEHNATGVSASGTKSAVIVGQSTIAGNTTGLSGAGSAGVQTFGTNQLIANATPGSFTLPVISPQ
jgi:hypothetical protein